MIITGLLGVVCLTVLALVVPCYFRASPAQAAAPAVRPVVTVKHAPTARPATHHRHRAGHYYRF